MRGLVVVLLVVFGCSGTEPATLEFRIAEVEPGEGLDEVVFPGSGETFFLHPEAPITQADIDTVQVGFDAGRPSIDLRMTPEGRRKFLELTRENVGKRCAMVVNGTVLSAPTIRAPITQGRAVIQGDFNEEEVQELVAALQRAISNPGPVERN